MKKWILISACIILYASCASSQSSVITKEAEEKVEKMKPLINLTNEQAEKMLVIEKDFIKSSKALKHSSIYNSQSAALKEKRIEKIKEILNRDQFIKLDIIENNRIKNVPIRVNN